MGGSSQVRGEHLHPIKKLLPAEQREIKGRDNVYTEGPVSRHHPGAGLKILTREAFTRGAEEESGLCEHGKQPAYLRRFLGRWTQALTVA